MAYTLSQAELEKLLGRPLTQNEIDNRELYLDIAKEQLELLLGLKMDGTADSERVYEAREGFRSLVIDPFSNNEPTVKFDDIDVTGFMVRQNADYNATWFNTIEFTERMKCGLYKVKATWGFGSTLPKGMQILWAGLFDVAANGQTANTDAKVKSETVLSHSVSFDTSSEAIQRFIESNAALIAKYRQTSGGMVYSPKGGRKWGSV